ncbi:MAG TPA: putative Ig domain-containing protein, partial [Bryobacteraceae bacterium]|nr:putative Ig domain-containing protein [Bryobacteraceae bacterium]
SLPAATQGSAYSQTLGATGRAGPYTWSVTQGTFSNAGLTLDAGSGAIGGTPLTAGTLTFTVQVSDGNSPADTATQVFSLPIALQTPATSDFAVTNAGTGIVRITADGKHTQTLCSGAPCHASNIAADAQGNIYARDQQGISAISPAGVVTPLVNFATSSFFSTGAGLGGIALDGLGNLIFVDNVTDSVYRVKTDGTGLTLVAALPVPSPQERQDAFVAVNSAGNYIVVSDDNGANRVYSFTPTGAPSTIATAQGGTASGISIDGSGNIDVLDYRANKIVQFTPAGVLSTVVALPASSGTYLGLTAETGTGDFISAIAGSAPELDRITPAGAITTIFAGAPLSAPLSIVQIPLLRLTVTPTSLPSGTVSQVYGPVTAMASGGSGTYTWSATGLPPGLSISQAGVIGGTPSTAGSYSVTITANDAAAGAQGSATITVVVAAVPPPPAPPTVSTLSISGSASSINVAQGGSVSATFSASGGTQPYTFSATGLPAGVTLDAAGSLAGSPTQPGNFSGNVKVTDSRSATASTAIAINVLGLTSAALPNGTSGQFYSAAIGAAGGTPPYSFIGTGLPAGLSISSAGNVTGTVKTSNTYSFQVKLSDSAGATVSGTFSVTFAAPRGLTISTAALPSGTVNSPYSQSFTATGGFPAYTWRVSAGSVPGGLSLTSSGTLAGVPTAPGSFQFGVMATDSSGAVATATATVTIQPTPLTVTTQALPSGVTGVPYPQQMLAAMGGVAPYTWAATSGALPAGLTLASNGVLTGTPTVTGSFPLGVTVTDSASATGNASLTVAVRPNSADLILSTGALTFSLVSPAAVAPAGQAFSVQSTQAALPLAYTVAVSPAAPWLMVTNGSATPDTIQAAIAPAGLALGAGIYQTTITLTCNSSACSGHTQSVPVTLTVTAGPPRLQVVTDLLAFGTSTAALQPMTQTIAIANAGGGSLGVASLSCEAAWCTVASGPGSLAGGVSASIPVTVNPALLTAGFFRTQIDITTSAGTGSVPVTVLIAADSSLTLAPVGDQFSLQAGGAPGNPNDSFLVSVSTPAAVNWTAAVVSATPWITVNTPTGTSSATQPGTVTYSINAQSAQLAQGTYYGVIEVKAGGVVNSPQDYEVVLNVLPANTPVDPLPSPGGLLFITAAGSTAPPQTITIYSSSMTPTGFQASAVTSDGGGWLSVSPNVGNASVAAPGITHAIVNASSLKPGIYRGGVSYSLSATAVRVVNVTAIVTAAASGQAITTSAQPRGVSPHVAGCTPGSLAPTSTELVNNFSAPVAWPQPLSIILSDNCGSLINTGQMVATFSNGDPPLPLTLVDPTKGLYSGTWTPRKAVPQMMILAHASAPSYPDATAQIVGSATPNSAPVLTPHGTLHSFYPLIGAALAPGTIIQIYGQNLASATAQPTTIPLPTSMNGTSVVVGGIPAPLYYVSAGQINAQLPFELDPSKQYQVLVLANGALTTPESVQLSPASPGMAAFADSTLIAQHGDGSLVSAASPAKAGEYLVSYLAGMGTTNATPASGAASPTSPLAMPVDMPTLTINGANAPIAFAGLTPGLVGLYQMNFQVPPGLPAGNITIVVTQGGQGSNQTVLPYQP